MQTEGHQVTVQPLEIKTIPAPITANMAGMVKLFGVHEHLIRDLVRQGTIRKVKLGESMQATSVYFVQDMIDHLASLAGQTKQKGN
jgi:hypothetical protein